MSYNWKQMITRMYSSRMRTARMLPWGGLPGQRSPWTETPHWTEIPLDRDPLDRDHFGQRPAWIETCLGKRPLSGQRPTWTETLNWTETPWTETPLDRDPPEQRSHWTETPLDRDLPGKRTPGQRTPGHRLPTTYTFLGQRTPLCTVNPYLHRDPPRQRTTPLDRDPRQRPPGQRPFLWTENPPTPHATGNDYFSKNQENGMEPMQRVIQLVSCNTVIVTLNFYKDTWCQLKTTKGGSKEPVKKFR